MILALDMGNTNIVVGCIEEDDILFIERISTNKENTALEYAVMLKTILEIHHIEFDKVDGAIISSVVPQLTDILVMAVEKILEITPLIVGPGIKTGLNIRIDNPKAMGADLIVDSVAAMKEYGYPIAVIDMGTATTITVVDENGTYIGGAFIPGVKVSMNALARNATQLNDVSLEAPEKVIAKNTQDAVKSGLVIGAAATIDGMLLRMEEELGISLKAVATGGLAHVVVPHCKRKIILDENLLLKGLSILYKKNKVD